jgi:hypothetical protein
MGTVIRFPDERRVGGYAGSVTTPLGPASVVILPVIRVERHEEPPGGMAPDAGSANGGRRRRRVRRS